MNDATPLKRLPSYIPFEEIMQGQTPAPVPYHLSFSNNVLLPCSSNIATRFFYLGLAMLK